MEPREAKINSNSYLSVTLVITLLGMAYMYGVQRQQINGLEDRLSRQESYAQDVVALKEQVKQIVATVDEVRQDVKTLVSTKK